MKRPRVTYNNILTVYTAFLMQYQFIGKFLGGHGGALFMYVILLCLSLYPLGFYKRYINQFKSPEIWKTLLALSLIFLYGIISIFWSRAPVYGITKMLFFIIIVSSMLLVAPIISAKKELFFKSSVIIAVFTLILVVIKHNNPFQLAIEMEMYNRFGDSYDQSSNPIFIGRYFGMISLIFLFSACHIKSFYLSVLNIAFFVIAGSYSILTGSKGPVLFLIVSSTIMILAKKHKPKYFLFLAFLFVIVTLQGQLNDNVMHFIDSDFIQNRFIDYDYRKSSGRMDLFETAINGVKKSTPAIFFFGYGVGDFAFYTLHTDRAHYPHNIFLEVLFEFGLFGLFGLFYVTFLFLKKFCHIRRELNDYGGLFGIIGFYFLLNSNVTGDLSSFAITLCFFIFYLFCPMQYRNRLVHK